MTAPLKNTKKQVRESKFPSSMFLIIFVVLLLMSGIHTGLIVLMNTLKWNKIIQSIIPMLYWSVVAVGLVFYIRWKMQKTYDEPMKDLAKATYKVANGDFSVYVPVLHTADKEDYMDVMIRDFNRMVEELGSMETLKTDFFSNVSHEIKTPMAVIQNTGELLRNEDMTPKQRQEYVETIIGASKRLSNLITNILKLNKLEKQNISPDKQPYDVCAQLIECALQFESVWEEKNIEFIADVEDKGIIYADADLMNLVWNNLLSNAFKFTSNGGAVTLSQISTSEGTEVTITDTGQGMNGDTVKHIFDKFYQGDTSHATQGNGLGLALAQRVLQLMDCTITVVSKLGEGTAFTVGIPLRSQEKNQTTEI